MSSDKALARPAADDERIHLVTIDWTRGKWSGVPGKCSREHLWHFAGKLNLKVTDCTRTRWRRWRTGIRCDWIR